MSEGQRNDHADHRSPAHERPPTPRRRRAQHSSRRDEHHGECRVVVRGRGERDHHAQRDRHQSRAPSPEERPVREHREHQPRSERHRVVRRQEQMPLAPQEVVRQQRVEDRAHDRDVRRERQPPQHEVRRQTDQRKRQQEEDVDHDRRVRAEEPDELEDQDVQRIPAERREVEELRLARRAQARVVPVPAVVEHALDRGLVEIPVADVEVRHVQRALPRLEHERAEEEREPRGERRVSGLVPAAQSSQGRPSARSGGHPCGSSSCARRSSRLAAALSPSTCLSNSPSSYQVCQFRGWRSIART